MNYILRCFTLTVSIFSICSIGNITAQDQISSTRSIVGKNIQTDKYVYGDIYEFPYTIESFTYDSVRSKRLYVNLKNDKPQGTESPYYFVNFDRRMKRTLNFETLHAQAHNTVSTEVYSWFNTANKVTKTDNTTGDVLKEHKQTLSYFSTPHKLGISVKNAGESVTAFDLNTGEKRWKTAIQDFKGWDSAQKLNKDAILVEANGIHCLRLTDGRGWHYSAPNINRKPAINEINAKHAPNAQAYSQTGISFISKDTIIDNISSNILLDKDTIFYAYSDTIVCLGKFGQVIWKKSVQKKNMSTSTLFTDNTYVYIINHGYASAAGKRIPYGKPFFSAYNKQTGERLFHNQLAFKGKPILHQVKHNNTLVIQTVSSILRYKLPSGAFIDEKKIDYAETGYFTIGKLENVYVINRQKQIEVFEKTALIFTDKNQYFTYHTNGQLIETEKMNSYLTYVGTIKENTILANTIKTIILDSNSKILMDLNLPQVSTIRNGKITCIDDNKIFYISMER